MKMEMVARSFREQVGALSCAALLPSTLGEAADGRAASAQPWLLVLAPSPQRSPGGSGRASFPADGAGGSPSGAALAELARLRDGSSVPNRDLGGFGLVCLFFLPRSVCAGTFPPPPPPPPAMHHLPCSGDGEEALPGGPVRRGRRRRGRRTGTGSEEREIPVRKLPPAGGGSAGLLRRRQEKEGVIGRGQSAAAQSGDTGVMTPVPGCSAQESGWIPPCPLPSPRTARPAVGVQLWA